MDDDTVTTKDAQVSQAYTIMLSGHDPSTGRQWSLGIQYEPRPALIFTGKKPPTAELMRTLQQIHAPIWSIAMFENLIDIAIAHEHDRIMLNKLMNTPPPGAVQ